MALLPLEEFFGQQLKTRPFEIPHIVNDYFEQYKRMVGVLRIKFYSKIDAGLAANSLASGFYTAHDAEHFDEVVAQAGALLGVVSGECINPGSRAKELNPYELYLLLAAIRIHDVGNMYGREGHENRCFGILKEMGDAAGLDDAEKKIIAKIAQAHGGKNSAGGKDTIGMLDAVSSAGKLTYRPQLLAGIVRIADEICENRRRAATVLLEGNNLPKHSEIYHRYAASIIANRWDYVDNTLHLEFIIRLSDVEKPWGCELRDASNGTKQNEEFLVNEIFARLRKMDRERRYCNVFTRVMFTIEKIKTKISIVSDEDHDELDSIKVPVLSDIGYPDVGEDYFKELANYCGSSYGTELRKKIGDIAYGKK
jgi:hypothetical protein